MTFPAASTSHLNRLLSAQQTTNGPGLCSLDGASSFTKRKLEQWQESDSLKNCTAEYASFQPAPRSTIALCYNCTGEYLASTHGDHTVKITSCQTGKLLRVLSGHRRTPWVVRFHPRNPSLLASGSLDHEVRLWDASTGEPIARHQFGKPIASLSFHISTDVLAIACGHKLYMWEYNTGKGPVIVLKTRRSMRAVHFHPHGLPMLLTAEVQDPSPTAALPQTVTDYGAYIMGKETEQKQQSPAEKRKRPLSASPCDPAQAEMDTQPGSSSAAATQAATEATEGWIWQQPPNNRDTNTAPDEHHTAPQPSYPAAPWPATAAAFMQQHAAAAGAPLPYTAAAAPEVYMPSASTGGFVVPPASSSAAGTPPPPPSQPAHLLPPSMVSVGYELPFPYANQPTSDQSARDAAAWINQYNAWNPNLMAAFSAAAWNIIGEEQPPRVRLRLWKFDLSKPVTQLDASSDVRLQLSDAVLCSEMGVHFSPCGRYIAATIACRSTQMLQSDVSPAAVQLAAMVGGQPLQPIPATPGAPVHPYMPAMPQRQHSVPATAPYNPFAAAAIPGGSTDNTEPMDTDTAAPPSGPEADAAAAALLGAATGSPSPWAYGFQATAAAPPERVVFEIRSISVDGDTFGQVVRAKRIRAAHCLTSVQFSPTSDHILLAYGKKHMSLLRSLVADRGSMTAMHTILEVFRLSDMQVVRVLPSAEDEINAACFHPAPGGGLAYGTKEGRLRIISHNRSGAEEDDEEGAASSHEDTRTVLDSNLPSLNMEANFAVLQAFLTHQQQQQGAAGVPPPPPPQF